MQNFFNQFAKNLNDLLKPDESFSLSFTGEETTFIRINQAKVRQSLKVDQGDITLTFVKNKRSLNYTFPFGHDDASNQSLGKSILEKCRLECEQLPEDPFCPFFEGQQISCDIFTGSFPKDEEWMDCLLPALNNTDSAGLLMAGKMMRGNITSTGHNHWYATENFCVDLSFYTPNQKAVKFLYADKNWDLNAFNSKVMDAKKQLEILVKQIKVLTPGHYRTYFAPHAVADFVTMLSWNGVNGSAYYQGQSAFKDLKDKEKSLSTRFNLKEDFSLGISPRFNSLGELAPQSLPIVQEGLLENLLINMRTAKEYNITSNQAELSEGLKSTFVKGGNLKDKDILSALGTGLYVSNVHYLNWSDLNKGRMTGMTRYACFWVEDGQIIAPIQDLRFDESLYHFWGEGLIDLTEETHLIPDTSTYWQRALGGVKVPGMLVDRFTYTL